MAIEGPLAGRRFNLRQRTRIGRALDNEIVLSDHMVSRYHAEIVRDGVEFVLRDLGSKNGFTVNRESANDHRLLRGDVIQVGQSRFLFEVPTQSHAARFSDRVVRLEPIGDEGIKLLAPEQLPLPPADEDQTFLILLGRLFTCPPESLAEALNDIMHRLMERFAASGAALMMRNGAGDAMPLVAAAEQGELHFSHEAIHQALAGGKAALAAALVGEGTQRTLRPRRAALLPLVRRDRVIGVLALQRPDGKEFVAEDLGLLQAYANLISAAAHHAIQSDQWVIEATHATQQSMIIGVSAAARSIREQIHRVAITDSTVLLTGETGTGKELAARAIHAASPRAGAPFVVIDCSAFPASLIESELFGHEAGAFTGADRMKPGKVELAEGGTLFLDEIGEMQLDLQPKLLRFLEELVFYRVGGLRPIHADVRIIAATNRDLGKAVAENRFRGDLLFRLNVMPIHLPPLRERIEDVRPLIAHFAPQLAARVGKPFLGLEDYTWSILEHYQWPGNVRELRHGLERALILSDDGILRPDHFQLAMPEPASATRSADEELTGVGSATCLAGVSDTEIAGSTTAQPLSMAEVEADAIRRALRFAGGNRVRASEILQIHRNTLAKKIQEYKIEL